MEKHTRVPLDLAKSEPDGVPIGRLSDVLPITDETAAGTLGFTMKALRSLGCPTWEELQQWNLILGDLWCSFVTVDC